MLKIIKIFKQKTLRIIKIDYLKQLFKTRKTQKIIFHPKVFLKNENKF